MNWCSNFQNSVIAGIIGMHPSQKNVQHGKVSLDTLLKLFICMNVGWTHHVFMHLLSGPLLAWILRDFFYLVLKIFWQLAILSMTYRWTYKDEKCFLHRPANTRAHLYCGCWGRNMPPIGMQWCSGTIYLEHLHHTSARGSLLWACRTAYFHQQCTRAKASISGESTLWLLTQIGWMQWDRPWTRAFSHSNGLCKGFLVQTKPALRVASVTLQYITGGSAG